MRRRIRIALLVLAVPVVLVAVANAVVLLQARGETARDVAALPHAQAALVLGAQVKPDGTPSDMLEDRIVTAEELYRAGKVDKLLLSGDHGRLALRRGRDDAARAARGRDPGARPVHRPRRLRHLGQRAAGAARVRVDSAIVVTQRFHLPRALFAARRAGLRVTGFAADRRDYGRVMGRLQLREALARVKVVADTVTGAQPRFSARGCRSAATAAQPGDRRLRSGWLPWMRATSPPRLGSQRRNPVRVPLGSLGSHPRRRRRPCPFSAAAAAVGRAPDHAHPARQPPRLRGAGLALPGAPAGVLPPHALQPRGRRGRAAGGLRGRVQRDQRGRPRDQRAARGCTGSRATARSTTCARPRRSASTRWTCTSPSTA